MPSLLIPMLIQNLTYIVGKNVSSFEFTENLITSFCVFSFRETWVEKYYDKYFSWNLKLCQVETLSRRKRQLLIGTTSYINRDVPGSLTSGVPFIRFLLPLFLKLFPNMLWSTFQDKMEEQFFFQLDSFLYVHTIYLSFQFYWISVSKPLKILAHFIHYTSVCSLYTKHYHLCL